MAANDTTPNPPPPRTQSQLEADLAATRLRLSGAVESLIDQVHPNRVKQRQLDGIKRFADSELEHARTMLFNARGDLRTDRVLVLAGAAVGAIAFLLIVRALVRHGRGD